MKLTKESIQELLETNDKAVGRALSALLTRQTASEQAMEDTIEHNGVGFTGVDGEFFTSLAKQFNRKGFLSPKQITAARKKDKRGVSKVGKYWRQLIEIAEEKQKIVQVEDSGNQAERELAEFEIAQDIATKNKFQNA